MAFENISEEQHASFVSSLRAGQYNLLLGAGASMDSSNSRGNLPSGTTFRNDLAVLKQANSNQPLQKIFSLLTPSEIKEHVTERFSNCSPGLTYQLLASFVWKRAFTFNIDDAMEAAYRSETAKQTILSYNFDDEYEDDRTLDELPLVHLHGDVTRPVRGYVFSREQYIRLITMMNPWMTVLAQFIRSEPFIVAGSSMDEVDLDYYLAYRTPTTARDDRGPSIRVEPFPDEITRNECRQHGLLLFIGTSLGFLKYCDSVLPVRPTPYELVPEESRSLVPAGVSQIQALSFLSDFELVPSSATELKGASPFFYGHPPSWRDLASKFDVSRPAVAAIVTDVERRLKPESNAPRILVVREETGTGKTTAMRRAAFELAQRGFLVLTCSALSRVEPKSTASIIDLIDDPLVIFVDNFADQAYVFRDVIDLLEKKDIVFVFADRGYRFRYITRVLAGLRYSTYGDLSLKEIDCDRLISSYVGHGLLGNRQALKNKKEFIKKIVQDPIAVACSRILADFRPLDRIIDDLLRDSSRADKERYYIASLAQYCFRGGVRYEVLSSAIGRDGLKDQIQKENPLPLAHFDRSTTFLVPQNSTLAERMLGRLSENDRPFLLEMFVALAMQIAARVNRNTVRRRTPEARLASRLFDFDSVVDDLLKEKAPEFYSRMQPVWQWNSRYWEQVALMHLKQYHLAPNEPEGQEALRQAAQHARHAVSVEEHPLPLTTLGKILLVQMLAKGYSAAAAYEEAYERLTDAIVLESKWHRKAVQPYVLLFRGSADYIRSGGRLSAKQIERIMSLVENAKSIWGRDSEIQEVCASVETEFAALRY
ncbi:P-loop NTPase [Bradyrhizobium liaoningense]